MVPFFCYFSLVYCVENEQFCDGEKKDNINCDGEKNVKRKKDVLTESKLCLYLTYVFLGSLSSRFYMLCRSRCLKKNILEK